MKNATSGEIEYAFFVEDYCIDCRNWRDNPDAKTQCKIAAQAGVGENYKEYWKKDCAVVFCEKWESRETKVKDTPKTELMEMMGV